MMDFRELDKTLIVAEVGVNHEGDVGLAKDMVRLAANAGADAVKFATFRIEHYISTVQPERRECIAAFQLSEDDFRDLAALALECGVTFFSTPLHPLNVDFLDTVAPWFKMASGDLNNTDFIRYVVGKGKPTIISTGYGNEDDVGRAVDAALDARPSAREDGSVMLMHCVGAYPTEPEDLNLRTMQWLKDTFGLPVGFSDHTLGIKACELAVAMGALAIEKHFTYRKENQAWHDHAVSADPKDMKALVAAVRKAEMYLGRYAKGAEIHAAETRITDMRRSVGAAVDIPAGVPIERQWLTWLRPAWGLEAARISDVVGRTLNRDVAAGELIHEEDLGK
jgi:N,N'-diacetyllegionaminate synthase